MNSTKMKENMITDYMKNVDFKSQNFSIDRLKNDIKQIIHEIPAIEISYNKERFIKENESGKKIKSVTDSVKSITIAFSDGDYDYGNNIKMPKIHRFTLYV